MPITYKNKKRLKNELVKRAEEHRAADRLVHGANYFTGFNGDAKGCAIGCLATPVGEVRKKKFFRLAQKTAINQLRKEFGIPDQLTLLAENIFESYDLDDASHDAGYRVRATKSRGDGSWPTRFAEALPVGVKLTNKDVREFVQGSDHFEPSIWRGEDIDPGDCFIDNVPKAANATLRWLRGLK